MRHPRIIIAGIGLAAVAAVGVVTGATAGGSTASTASSTQTTAPAVPGTATATVHTTQAASGASPRPSWSITTASPCTSTGPTPPPGRWSPEGWPSYGLR